MKLFTARKSSKQFSVFEFFVYFLQQTLNWHCKFRLFLSKSFLIFYSFFHNLLFFFLTLYLYIFVLWLHLVPKKNISRSHNYCLLFFLSFLFVSFFLFLSLTLTFQCFKKLSSFGNVVLCCSRHLCLFIFISQRHLFVFIPCLELS